MIQVALSVNQLTRLRACEAAIKKGLNTLVEVGNALLRIRDARLYRQKFSTFEDYCRDQWRMSVAQGKRLIAAAEVVANLAPKGAIQYESQDYLRRKNAGLKPLAEETKRHLPP